MFIVYIYQDLMFRMEGRAIHTIFYKGIPVGEYSTERAPFIRMEDFEQIYALHIDRFDNEGKFEAEIRLILTFIQSFLETGIPEGIRRDVLETQTQSKNFLDLVNLIDEFTSDISIDKTDQRFSIRSPLPYIRGCWRSMRLPLTNLFSGKRAGKGPNSLVSRRQFRQIYRGVGNKGH